MALVISPENLMPPSAISGTPDSRAARLHSAIAVSCGTPAPETMRVVQMEPGPMPTLMPSTPRSISRARLRKCRHCRDQLHVGHALLDRLHGLDHAQAVGVRGIDGDHVHFAAHQFLARSRKSPVAPMAAPTRRRPCSSLAALGYFSFF
jgi:hypothetical protein